MTFENNSWVHTGYIYRDIAIHGVLTMFLRWGWFRFAKCCFGSTQYSLVELSQLAKACLVPLEGKCCAD